jgi:hypothetical protein
MLLFRVSRVGKLSAQSAFVILSKLFKQEQKINYDSHVLNLRLRPKLTPHTYEKGVNLLRIQAAICLHSSHAKYCNT